MFKDLSEYLKDVEHRLRHIDQSAMRRWSEILFRAWQEQQTVFVIGNGGSATTASHIAEDLGKNTTQFAPDGRRLRVLSLTDNVGWITALANDLSYDQVFVQQLMNYARPGDVLLAISVSGNSQNVLNAVDWANRSGLITFGLTGYDGGQLSRMQQHGLHIELDDMGIVEGIHLCVFHWVLEHLCQRIAEGERRIA